MIEFMPWYTAGVQLLVCDACGAVVRDTDLHLEWHEKLGPTIEIHEDQLDGESVLHRFSKRW